MPLPDVYTLLKQYEASKHGIEEKPQIGSKYIYLGYDVLKEEPKKTDVSKPLNSLWYGRKNAGKSMGLFSWTDGHYYRGYINDAFHDLHGENSERHLPNPHFFEDVNRGANACEASLDDFLPNDSMMQPFGWDKEHIKIYTPEFIKQGTGKKISLDFTSLSADMWMERLGYHVGNRQQRRAFKEVYETIAALKKERSDFRMDRYFLDNFFNNPASFLDEKALKNIPIQNITDVLSVIESELIETKVIEGEYTANLMEVFSGEDDVIFDYSKLDLMSQLRRGDALDPRDIFVTVSICVFYEWLREMRDNGDKTPYRVSLDEMQRILTSYRAQGSLKQPLSLQAIGLFLTQARKYGAGFDVAFQTAISYVPKEVVQSFDLVCISDMPMDKTDRYFLMETFKEYRDALNDGGFGSGRPYHFWVIDTVARDVSLIVPYPNRSKKAKESVLSSLELKGRTRVGG